MSPRFQSSKPLLRDTRGEVGVHASKIGPPFTGKPRVVPVARDESAQPRADVLDPREEVEVAVLGGLPRVHVDLAAVDAVLVVPDAAGDRGPADLAERERVGSVLERGQAPKPARRSQARLGARPGFIAARSRSSACRRRRSRGPCSGSYRRAPTAPLGQGREARQPAGRPARPETRASCGAH